MCERQESLLHIMFCYFNVNIKHIIACILLQMCVSTLT